MTDVESVQQAIVFLEGRRRELVASIEVELTEIDAAITVLRKQAAKGSVIIPPPGTRGRVASLTDFAPTPLASGPYAEMEFADAARDYILKAGEPQTTREIADALYAGGFKTRSQDWPRTAGTLLKRNPAVNAGIRKNAEGKWYVEQ